MIAASPDAARSGDAQHALVADVRDYGVGIGRVGDDRDPQDAHPLVARDDHFGDGGHPDGVGADLAQEAQLGAGLEARTATTTYTLVDRHAEVGAHRQHAGAQERVVLVRHVQEADAKLGSSAPISRFRGQLAG